MSALFLPFKSPEASCPFSPLKSSVELPQGIRYVSGDSDKDEEPELDPAVSPGLYPFGGGSYSILNLVYYI